MPIIDVQVHAYDRNYPGRPWVGHLAGPEHVTGDEMVAAMGAVGVDGAILVSPFALYRFDASYALDVYTAHPGRFGLVKPVDTEDPGVPDTVAAWAATKVQSGSGSCSTKPHRPIPPIWASTASSPPRRGTTCR